MGHIVPTAGNVVVKRKEAAEKSEGGIHLPTAAREVALEGAVIASSSAAFKKGDQVVFGLYAGTQVVLDKETYLVMAETEILAILKDGKTS